MMNIEDEPEYAKGPWDPYYDFVHYLKLFLICFVDSLFSLKH
jgi:hypothetical protein